MTIVELKSGANCLTPDDDTSQISIMMDPANKKMGCTLIRACTLNRSNTVFAVRASSGLMVVTRGPSKYGTICLAYGYEVGNRCFLMKY